MRTYCRISISFPLNVFILCLSGYDSRIFWNFFFITATKEHYPLGVRSSVWSQGTECLVTCVFTDARDVLVLPKFCKIVCCARFSGRLYSIVFLAFTLRLPIQTFNFCGTYTLSFLMCHTISGKRTHPSRPIKVWGMIVWNCFGEVQLCTQFLLSLCVKPSLEIEKLIH